MTIKEARRLINEGKTTAAIEILQSIIKTGRYPQPLVDEASRIVQELSNIADSDKPLSQAKRTDKTAGISNKLGSFSAKPYRCTVISWDANHNCLGRAFIIAQLAGLIYKKVDLIGYDFKHLGTDVWEPLRGADPKVLPLASPRDVNEMVNYCENIASTIDTDLIIACKSRLPSLLLGCLIKKKSGAPLIVDIDDYELGFFRKGDESMQYHEVSSFSLSREATKRKCERPYSSFWTIYAERLLGYADEIITSNTSLQERYGGLVIPHVRDQSVFYKTRCLEPTPKPKSSNDYHVTFLGTPRRHKGVVELAKACYNLRNEGVKCTFIGSFTDPALKQEVIAAGGNQTQFIENIPFSTISEYLIEANLIVLLQDPNLDASRFQLPAKAIDAIAADKLLIATETDPLKMLVKMGFKGIRLIDSNLMLEDAIKESMHHPLSEEESKHNNKLFANFLSYDAGLITLKKCIDNACRIGTVNRKKVIVSDSRALLDTIRLLNTFVSHNDNKGSKLVEVIRNQSRMKTYIILWKQNDYGIFGRRVDMVAKYLESRQDTERVIVIEAPLTELDIIRLRQSENSHHNLIYRYLYKKKFLELNTDKLSFIQPVSMPGLTEKEKKEFVLSFIQERLIEATALKNVLNSTESDTVIWAYPFYPYVEELIAAVQPDFVVADIVDDQRRWPGISEARSIKITDNYHSILDLSDISLYNCEETMNTIGLMSKRKKFLVKNGVDVLNIDCLRNEKSHEIDCLKGSFGFETIIGYAGNLESKIDWVLIEKLAEAFPSSLILLVGSTHASTQLPQKSNIKYTGPIPYAEMPLLLCTFNVAIVPHLTTDLTKTMNPLKVYVYANLGIPIIASSIPNLPSQQELPQLKISDSHDSFISDVSRSLLHITAYPNFDNSEFAKVNCWPARLDPIVDFLKQATTS